MDGLKKFDISHEQWREYELGDGKIYRIKNPVDLYLRPGGTHHRIVDEDGVVHCLPEPGYRDCVLRWQNAAGAPPVEF